MEGESDPAVAAAAVGADSEMVEEAEEKVDDADEVAADATAGVEGDAGDELETVCMQWAKQ